MRKRRMQNLRLSKKEQDQLRKKSIQINKVLIGNEFKPVTESELMHILIKEGLERLEAGNSGKVVLL